MSVPLLYCSYFAIIVNDKSGVYQCEITLKPKRTGETLLKYFLCIVCIFSGGTVVTVTGSNLDSVAVPLVSLTVVITKWNNSCCIASTVRILEEVVIL